MPKSATIIGAGPTGLTAAYYLTKAKVPVTILEKTKKVGGMAASFDYEYQGEKYSLDYGPHKFYTQIPGVYDIYKEVLGKNVLTVAKKNSIRIKGKYFDFPVSITQLATRMPPQVAAQVGLGVGMTLLSPPKTVKSFEDHFIRGFGKYGYELLFKDYAKKVWGDPKKLSEELARKRVPVSSAFGLLKTMLKKPDKKVSADRFLYPKLGGFGALSKALESKVLQQGGSLLYGQDAGKILWNKKRVTHVRTNVLDQASDMPVEYLVSTLPIHILPTLFEPKAPAKVLAASKALKFRSLRIFYLFVDKKPIMSDNWRFFPEERYIFNRVSEMSSFSPHTTPKGKSVLMVEVTCGDDDKKSKMENEELFTLLVQHLVDAEILSSSKDVKHYITKRASNVYPIYDLEFKKNLAVVLEFLSCIENCISLGRAGLFNYNNTDHCLDMGKRAAEWITSNGSKKNFEKLLAYFDSYAIVD